MNPTLTDQDMPHNQSMSGPSPSQTNLLQGNKSGKQIPVLDGVRAIACLSVLLFHVSFIYGLNNVESLLNYIHIPSGIFTFFVATFAYFGETGVILFFLLSGFLLFLPYAKALLFESSWPSLRRFYLRRFFRILPGYYVALFFMALFFSPQFLLSNHWHDFWLFLIFCMDYKLSGQLNGPFWTLAIEFQFYLLLPIIAWLFSLLVRHGTVHRRMLTLTLCLLGMVAWGLLTRYWGFFIANTPNLNYSLHAIFTRLKPFLYGDRGKYFEVFAVGMLLCMVYTYIQHAHSAEFWHSRMRRLSPLILTMGLALLFFLSLWHFYFIDIDPLFFKNIAPAHDATSIIEFQYWIEWQALAYAISYGFCMLALLFGSPRLKRPFESSPLRWVASISFSLYMWHFNFMRLFATIPLVNMQQLGWSPLVQYAAFWCWTLLVIIPISAMLYRWIEQPGMRLGEWLIRKLER